MPGVTIYHDDSSNNNEQFKVETANVHINEDKDVEILKFTTVGSVDDGKSTLIGRMLYDSKSVFEDQLAAVAKTSSKKGHDGVDLALLTDGLAAEREQGITIDVAYRYFSTPKRKFIIADTPGHVQYTRNMVTGASTANLTIILIDARKGLSDQSRRHAFISSLLGINKLIVAINKMDLVDYSEEVFNNIKADFKEMADKLNITDDRLEFIPISALKGDNVVFKNPANPENNDEVSMPWFSGRTVMEVLENTPNFNHCNSDKFRLPIQYVLRVDNAEYPDFRGFAGQIASGDIKVGDEVISYPSKKTAKVESIHLFEDKLEQATSPQSVTVTLDREIDTSRGDILAKSSEPLMETKLFDADLCWMAEEKFSTKKKYILKYCSSQLKVMCSKINFCYDIHSFAKKDQCELELNDIASVEIKALKPIAVEPYADNRFLGSFILIDEISFNTVAAGMIRNIK